MLDKAAKRYFSRFPEHKYPCTYRPTDYNYRIMLGLQRMMQTNIAICGLARDIRHTIYRSMASIEAIGEMFHDYNVFIYENDSTDGTQPILQEWASTNPKVTVHCENYGNTKWGPDRTEIEGELRCLSGRMDDMAAYRNACQTHITDNYHRAKYVIILDLDFAGGWSYDGIAHSFGLNNWDIIGGNSIIEHDGDIQYYDSWAYREVGHPTPHPDNYVNTQIRQRGEPLVKLLSCFGGMCIYTMQAFGAATYGGSDYKGRPECEHVVFHQRIAQVGFNRFFLNPSLITVVNDDGTQAFCGDSCKF